MLHTMHDSELIRRYRLDRAGIVFVSDLIREKLTLTLLNFYLCGIQVSGPAQATCSNTLSSACTRHFHTPLCVHNPTKD